MSNEWHDPVRLNDEGLVITIATAAQAKNFLQHSKRRVGWREALDKCEAAAQGRLSNDEARQAFIKAAH